MLKLLAKQIQADPSSLFAKSPSDKFVACSWDLMRLIRVYHPELWPPVHLRDFSHSVSLAFWSSSNMIDILPQIFPKNPSTNPWLPQSGFNGFVFAILFFSFCSYDSHIPHEPLRKNPDRPGDVLRRSAQELEGKMALALLGCSIYISPAVQSDLRLKKWGCRAILQCLCNAYVTYIYI